MLYITISPTLVIFLVLQAYIKPFKNGLVNILDCWLIMNLTFLYLITWYFTLENRPAITIFFISSVFQTLLTFFIVIDILVTGKVNTFKEWIEYRCEKVLLWRKNMSF